MTYSLIVAALFGVLFGESARSRESADVVSVALIGFVGFLLALAVPALLFKYSNRDDAALVLTALARRAGLGSLISVGAIVLAWLVIARIRDAGLFGEFFLFALAAIFLTQFFGEMMTRHVMYLQQTKQYNSDQLVAVLLTVTFVLLIIVLYFVAFDLARPPTFHPYLRDAIAISLILVIYSRSVFRMAHH